MIQGEDGQKMSKSRGNVINPDDVVKEYGADSFRLYEMFMGPLENQNLGKPRDYKAVTGFCRRYGAFFMIKLKILKITVRMKRH